MKVILYSKICKGDVAEYECKSVKITGRKIEIFINKNWQVIWNTDCCDVEIINE